MKYKICIVQSYRVSRSIEIEVNADSAESALEDVASGAVDTPSFYSADWLTGWELMDQSETVAS